jgi:hypothetical protein
MNCQVDGCKKQATNELAGFCEEHNTFTDQDIDDAFRAIVEEEWPHAYMKHQYPCPLTDEKDASCPAGLSDDCELCRRKPN